MKRRTFIQGALATAAATPILLDSVYARASSPLKLLAQLGSTNDNVLILVQMFGGNDGLNTIVPANDDNYYKLRPTIGIPSKSLLNRGGANGFYMNPGLGYGDKGGLAGMFDVGQLAIIQGIGYANPNLSHFRSTDIWLSGIDPDPSNGNEVLNTGWLGRFLEQQYPDFPSSLPTDPIAINFGGFSLALTSEKGQMGIAVNSPGLQAAGLDVTSDTLDDQSAGTRYALEYAFVQDVANRSNVYAQRVKDAYSAGKTMLKGNYANDGFAKQMASVAALIAGGLKSRVYFVSLGGFDTHVNQADGVDPSTGAHADLLGQMADAIAQFQSDLLQFDQAGLNVSKKVVGFTISEFGRRPAENGSLGTDHGAASVQFAFGTQINGGVFGHTPDLSSLDANDDLGYQIDFRSVYSTLLTDWFGMDLADAQTVLQDQNDAIVPLSGLIKPAAGVSQNVNPAISLSVYPNPVSSSATITFDLPVDCYAEMELTSMDGKSVQTVLSRKLSSGSFSVPLSTELPAGSYLLSLRAGSSLVTRVVEIIR